MKKPLKIKSDIRTTQELLQVIKSALIKLNTPSTIPNGVSELKEIMKLHITNNSRMNTLITAFAEPNERMNLTQKKEAARVYGIMGEVFTKSLIPYFGKIINSLKPRWNDYALHIALSDSFGVMIHHVFKKFKDQIDPFKALIQNLIEIVKESRQEVQIGSAMCLTRAIQNVPPEALPMLLPNFTNELLLLLKAPGMKCMSQLLEIVISIILSLDKDFEKYAAKFVPILIDNMAVKQDWSIRKLAIDAVYTLATIIPQTLEKQCNEICNLLREAKTDKIKHIRDAAHVALIKLKDEGLATEKETSKIIPDEKNIAEGGKSIFDSPINPKFMKAAPKKIVEIHSIVPIVNSEADILNKSINEEEQKNKEDHKEENEQNKIENEAKEENENPIIEKSNNTKEDEKNCKTIENTENPEGKKEDEEIINENKEKEECNNDEKKKNEDKKEENINAENNQDENKQNEDEEEEEEEEESEEEKDNNENEVTKNIKDNEENKDDNKDNEEDINELNDKNLEENVGKEKEIEESKNELSKENNEEISEYNLQFTVEKISKVIFNKNI